MAGSVAGEFDVRSIARSYCPLLLLLAPLAVSVAQAHCARPIAGSDCGRFVGEEHAALLIGVAARNGAQRARTIEPAIDFRTPMAAERALGGAIAGAAVRADQAIGFFGHGSGLFLTVKSTKNRQFAFRINGRT